MIFGSFAVIWYTYGMDEQFEHETSNTRNSMIDTIYPTRSSML